ncbi:DUF4394 domain-containing protein [Streptomyces caniscabiei]|uniref:DUF4394 domain-containing protein n=1 Tax=Streptomyces caniscabiei TaxID=2746961 RepID=UPI0029AF3AC0|nr:DUF4394 domain-containing protein [Streptomyces caniscabiei]MDX2598754.1 DUF4394 domain-containing protein [Streptomyces caniscabiei]MDX2736216.1 DUF4394 domain-containing protein [Streptomyces caniscabiei]MDX2780293.1 DUF4394 domain-containing protein [Streptomyces caniscabiei]
MRKQAVIGVLTMAVAIGTVGAVGTGALGGSGALEGSGSSGGSGASSGSSASAGVSAGDSVGTGTDVEAKGGLLGGGAKVPGGLKAVGLTTDQRLVVFRVDKPGAVVPLGRVHGLKGDTRLVGIDYRVQNNKLYGVGDKGGVYTLREAGAKVTKVSQLTVALQGKAYGVDFNPAANRLRVISDTGQNLRHNLDDPQGAPAAGTTAVDGTLTDPPVPPATAGVTARGATGAAYTNNDLDTATATTLFDLDTAQDRISLQSPANAGTLAPTGGLGVDAPLNTGFDIYSSARSGVNAGYAVTGSRLFAVNLLTGKVSSAGTFPKGRQVVDLAIPLRQG